MAYNRENFLKRVIKIQELALHYKAQGLFLKEIYFLHIQNQYHISKRTFDYYLGLNARKQLKELHQKNNLDNQLNLFE